MLVPLLEIGLAPGSHRLRAFAHLERVHFQLLHVPGELSENPRRTRSFVAGVIQRSERGPYRIDGVGCDLAQFFYVFPGFRKIFRGAVGGADADGENSGGKRHGKSTAQESRGEAGEC